MGSTTRKFSSIILTVLVLISFLSKCSTSAASDRVTNEYIFKNVLPNNPVLAATLLSILARSRPTLTSYVQPLIQNKEDMGQFEVSDVLDALRPSEKRGLGQCIHNCINGRGNMNFIQCKSMCH